MEKLLSEYRERYQNEADFFDREVEEMFKNEQRLKFSNQLTYEDYFGLYTTYSVVKDYFGSVQDKKILDYACGSGWISIYLARSGAQCYGFDISPKSVKVATRMAEVNGVGSRCKFSVTAAEKMDFPDNYFDFVFGNAALHHTDLDKSPAEIARVLKPGGKAAFIDDLRHHPVMWLYRKLTSDKHTHFETPMIHRNIEQFKPYFQSAEFESYDFLSIFPKRKGLTRILRPIDAFILRVFPFMKHFYRHIVIKLIK
jgi:ubiquinone/menaquinone biosynthesis C-methylase UbiE